MVSKDHILVIIVITIIIHNYKLKKTFISERGGHLLPKTITEEGA
jgi:hypothetical protein